MKIDWGRRRKNIGKRANGGGGGGTNTSCFSSRTSERCFVGVLGFASEADFLGPFLLLNVNCFLVGGRLLVGLGELFGWSRNFQTLNQTDGSLVR